MVIFAKRWQVWEGHLTISIQPGGGGISPDRGKNRGQSVLFPFFFFVKKKKCLNVVFQLIK
jgi:hypothetical protein